MSRQNKHTRSSYYNKLSDDVRDRYDEKINKCNGIDPYAIKEKDLSKDIKDFPEITLLDIGNYFVHSTSSFTKKTFKAYKSMESYRYFQSGFVLSMGSKKNENTAIIRGKVKHSQRMNKSPENVWILVKMDGEIICGHCTCLAGISETCSHTGAICFAISSIAESFGQPNEIKSVTDLLCKWNVPSFKDVSMSAVKDIQWTTRSLEVTPAPIPESNFLEYCNSLTNFSDDTIDAFIRDCHSEGDETGLGTIIFSNEIRRRTNIKDEVFLASLFDKINLNKSFSELVQIAQATKIEISNDDVKEISRLTELNAKHCLALRRGRITGSIFKSCCVANINDPPITTINRVINPIKNFDFAPSVRYQIKNKKKAIEVYFSDQELKHENILHNRCGLVINPRFPYFAGSPDGLVECDCHGKGCFKIKCLKMLESCTSFEILTRKPSPILDKIGDNYVLDKNHEFYYQIQLQMHLIGLKYCDLILWSSKCFLIITTKPDFGFLKVALKKAQTFHENVIMPELLGKFYTRKSDLPEDFSTFMQEHDEENFDLVELEIELLDSNE